MSNEEKTYDEIEEEKKSSEYVMVKNNAVAIAETLEHHGKVFDELHGLINQLRLELTMLKQEQVLQKSMIVKSLSQKYGTGPTER